jgi:hypothetical protein
LCRTMSRNGSRFPGSGDWNVRRQFLDVVNLPGVHTLTGRAGARRPIFQDGWMTVESASESKIDISFPIFHIVQKTVWPSGLRRWLQAPVRKGVGSNPTAVISADLRS